MSIQIHNGKDNFKGLQIATNSVQKITDTYLSVEHYQDYISTLIAPDSFKIRIPLDKVRVIRSDIHATKSLINNDTGEVLKEFKNRSIAIEYNGVKLRFGIETQRTANQDERDFLVILINSKILHDRYFEGITLSNLPLVYERIMSHNVVEFSYNDFLKGELTDLDLKKDVLVEDFQGAVKIMTAFAKEYKQLKKGYNKFNERYNKGIHFGDRKTATKCYPFLKLYQKALELQNNSSDFYGSYLLDHSANIRNLSRLEFTIKNKDHFRTYGIKNSSLESILNLDQEKLNEIMTKVLSIHLDKRKSTRKSDNLGPNDQGLLNSIAGFMEFGCTYDVAKYKISSNVSCDRGKKRLENNLDGLYRDYIKGGSNDLKNKLSERFFNEIGWKA